MSLPGMKSCPPAQQHHDHPCLVSFRANLDGVPVGILDPPIRDIFFQVHAVSRRARRGQGQRRTAERCSRSFLAGFSQQHLQRDSSRSTSLAEVDACGEGTASSTRPWADDGTGRPRSSPRREHRGQSESVFEAWFPPWNIRWLDRDGELARGRDGISHRRPPLPSTARQLRIVPTPEDPERVKKSLHHLAGTPGCLRRNPREGESTRRTRRRPARGPCLRRAAPKNAPSQSRPTEDRFTSRMSPPGFRLRRSAAPPSATGPTARFATPTTRPDQPGRRPTCSCVAASGTSWLIWASYLPRAMAIQAIPEAQSTP